MDRSEINFDDKSEIVYIVSGGEVTEIHPPHHGELIIKTVQGKVQKYDTRESHKL